MKTVPFESPSGRTVVPRAAAATQGVDPSNVLNYWLSVNDVARKRDFRRRAVILRPGRAPSRTSAGGTHAYDRSRGKAN